MSVRRTKVPHETMALYSSDTRFVTSQHRMLGYDAKASCIFNGSVEVSRRHIKVPLVTLIFGLTVTLEEALHLRVALAAPTVNEPQEVTAKQGRSGRDAGRGPGFGQVGVICDVEKGMRDMKVPASPQNALRVSEEKLGRAHPSPEACAEGLGAAGCQGIEALCPGVRIISRRAKARSCQLLRCDLCQAKGK